MKRIIALCLALCLVFAFVGCGNKANEEAQGSYTDLMVIDGLDLAVEEYGIGFRSGSDIVPEVDKIIKELYEDGTLKTIAEKYDLAANLSEIKETESRATGESDLEYVKNKGKLTIGYTVYAPMNYTDDKGEFVGFDTEFAKAVCEKLGVEPEFVEINWDTKEMELDSKMIDCIWNGFTITEEREENLDFSVPYILNKQVVVIRKADADTYKDAASLSGAKLVAEVASAGESAISDDENLSKAQYTAVEKQTDALLEVKSNTADAAVLDYTLANAMVGK
jgi:polar amino acid transport system substrate-binding protein